MMMQKLWILGTNEFSQSPLVEYLVFFHMMYTMYMMYVEDDFIKAKVTISDAPPVRITLSYLFQTTSLPWVCVNELRVLYLHDVTIISLQIKI